MKSSQIFGLKTFRAFQRRFRIENRTIFKENTKKKKKKKSTSTFVTQVWFIMESHMGHANMMMFPIENRIEMITFPNGLP